MRSRSIRLSIVIVVILGFALAALGFPAINIDLPGFPALTRDGEGPLGLKLGLDLRGGGHLVYQADTGTRFDITFAEDTSVAAVEEALTAATYGPDELPLETEAIIPRDLRLAPAEPLPAIGNDAGEDAAGDAGEDAGDTTGEDAAGDSGDDAAGDAGDDAAGDAGDDAAGDAGDDAAGDTADDAVGESGDTGETPAEAAAGDMGDEGDTAAEDEAGTPEEAPLPPPELVLTRLQIRTTLLPSDDPRRAGLRETLNAVSPVSFYQVSDIPPPTPQQMEGVLDNITRRVNRFGTEEPIIQTFGEDRVIVQLPGASGSSTNIVAGAGAATPEDMETLRQALDDAGYSNFTVAPYGPRSFRVTSDTVGAAVQTAARANLEENLPPVDEFEVTSGIDEAKALIGQTALLEFKERTCQTEACIDFTDTDLGLTGDDLSRAEAAADPVGVGWVINLQFNGRGTDIFDDLTQRIVGERTKRIAIFMDDQLLLAPVSNAWIRDGRTEITGNFSREEAQTLAIQLESGRLQVPLRLIQESDVDALLGSESLRNSLLAGLVGLGLVLLFMVAYYRAAGLVAAAALVFYAVIVLAAFKLIPITLELAHIGGFILSIGMAVDANILIFERMKEEVRIGRTLSSSMEVGFSRAWPAIRDSNISTMLTCLVLLWFGDRLGGGLVTGVAISLFIGVAASMFTAVVVSRNLLQLLAWAGLGGRLNLFTPEALPRAAQAEPTGGRR